jgi:hypothetical protein
MITLEASQVGNTVELALAGAAANSASARIGSVKARFMLLAPV